MTQSAPQPPLDHPRDLVTLRMMLEQEFGFIEIYARVGQTGCERGIEHAIFLAFDGICHHGRRLRRFCDEIRQHERLST